MSERTTIIADDYGLSPGVSRAIRQLIENRKIDGTGCMTLFPEWPEEALLLRELAGRCDTAIGLHITLTDFAPLSKEDTGRGAAKLPSLSNLMLTGSLGLKKQDEIDRELDAQLERFIRHMGKHPDFIDGHQHVHFLPCVRRWLETRRSELRSDGRLPWLRGAPSLRFLPDWKIRGKAAFVRLIASGFDRQMKQAGFSIAGPLAGFYDWNKPETFAPVIQQLREGMPEGAVLMCHPGWIDETLKSRDRLTAARPAEFDALQIYPT